MSERVLTLTSEELKQIVRDAVREELDDAGLRLDGPEHRDSAREDFRFLRRLRQTTESTASKIGMAVILAVSGGLITAVWSGIKFSLSK